MKELTKTRRLIISTIIFVLIIIIGFLTFRKPDFEYQISRMETLEELYNIENELLPDELMDIISYSDSNYVLIDLRNPYDYQKGHLGEALNIPTMDILNKENVEFLEEMKKDSVSVVLYANDQIDANGTWMLLRQLGYDNVKILLGGYDYFTKEVDFYDEPEIPEYFIEEPQLNFAEIIENVSGDNNEDEGQEDAAKQIVPVKRKKKVISEGGC